MNSRKFSLLLMFAAMLAFSSCSTRLVDFTIISSKNFSLDIDKSQGVQVEESDNGFLGLGVSIKGAMDKALESAGPEYDILVDGVVSINNYFLVSGYKVKGTAISSSNMKAMLGEDGYQEWCKANNIFDPSEATVQN
jgi:hypothetical protein